MPIISCYFKTAKNKNFQMTVPCTIFEAYLINPLRFSIVNFSNFTPRVGPFFVEKRQPKILGFKHLIKKGISKIPTLVIR